uniref:Putative secreted protein n=1 Tax=Ixodes scapularis TaxID=6945 RepID=A0A4D5S0U5_IXOSC
MHANCTFRQCPFKVFVAIEVAVVLSVFLHEVSLLCVRISTIIISFSILLSLKGSTKQSFLLESRHFLLLHVSAMDDAFHFSQTLRLRRRIFSASLLDIVLLICKY